MKRPSLAFSDILLKILVFMLPTQLGLHFWPSFSRAAGIKVDYLSPTLYLNDIFILLYLAISVVPLIKLFKLHIKTIFFLLAFVTTNIFFSISPMLALSWWLRVCLYLFLFLVIRLRQVSWKDIQIPLIASTVLVIAIEFFQLFQQSSLNGPFYWLGERMFSSSTPGIGRLDIFGLEVIRPQSIFSHPNSLAGYLLVVYLVASHFNFPRWFKTVVLLGLLVTFSKAAIIAFVSVFLFRISPHLVILISLVLSATQLALPYFSTLPHFISDRLFFIRPTKLMIFQYPFGVGLGNYIPALVHYLSGSFLTPSKLQPVHNLPLLLITELGLVGLSGVLYLVKINLKKLNTHPLLSLISLILITGAFDHYWWSLHQNRLILLLVSAILL